MLIADRQALGQAQVALATTVLAGIGEHAHDVRLVERDATGDGDDRGRLARLELLRAATHAAGVELVVSGRADLACAIGADGVQLGERALPPEVVRSMFPDLKVGRSCHDRAGLERAAAAGVDWAWLSPLHAPHTKDQAGPVLGLAGFAAAIVELDLAVYALGGVVADDLGPVIAAGGAGVATIGGVFLAPDPVAAVRAYLVGLVDKPAMGSDNRARLTI